MLFALSLWAFGKLKTSMGLDGWRPFTRLKSPNYTDATLGAGTIVRAISSLNSERLALPSSRPNAVVGGFSLHTVVAAEVAGTF